MIDTLPLEGSRSEKDLLKTSIVTKSLDLLQADSIPITAFPTTVAQEQRDAANETIVNLLDQYINAPEKESDRTPAVRYEEAITAIIALHRQVKEKGLAQAMQEAGYTSGENAARTKTSGKGGPSIA